MNLDGKTAFITGGGGGIGGGMAEAFVEKGMNVVLADIDLDFAQKQADKLGERAFAVALDVTCLDSWKKAREAALQRFGSVEVLCNNAGISMPREPIDQVPVERFAQVMAINVTGVYNGIRTFADDLRKAGSGHIVNTSSMNGLLPFGTFGPYSASKFAVLGLSDALRQEMAPHGVGVSTLFPGLTRSRMSEGDMEAGDIPQELKDSMMEPVWLGRAVVRAIESDEPYIISHPGYRPMLEARCQELLAAFGDPAQPGYSGGSSSRG